MLHLHCTGDQFLHSDNFVEQMIKSNFNGSNIFRAIFGNFSYSWVVCAPEQIITPGQEANGNNLGMSFELSNMKIGLA